MRTADDNWTIDQVVFLVREYPTEKPLSEIKAGIDKRGPIRSLDAIGRKARALDVWRRVNTSRFNGRTGKPFTKGENRQPTPLRDYITAALIERKTLTVAQVKKETGSRASSCWRVFRHLINQGNCHVGEYRACYGGSEAVYRVGAGTNATRKTSLTNPVAAPAEKSHDINPIPSPMTHLWGICIKADLPTERITAP